jgi:signal transduction histidine kinase
VFFPADALGEVDQAVRIIGGVGLVVLVLAAVVALALASRVLRPVRELTSTARRVSDNDLTARFDVSGDDELAMLGSAFNDMLDRLESGFGTQRDVLDDVAHELRTPITIVRGHLELLDDDPVERAATVELCLDELDRMGRYVEELLLVASARRPDFLSPAPVDVGELTETLFAKISALGERDWRLLESPRPGALFVEADADRLTQAVVNLANNAVQHTGDGDRIELAVRRTDLGWALSGFVRGSLPVWSTCSRFSRAAGSCSTPRHRVSLASSLRSRAHGAVSTYDPPGGARVIVPILDADDHEEDLP